MDRRWHSPVIRRPPSLKRQDLAGALGQNPGAGGLLGTESTVPSVARLSAADGRRLRDTYHQLLDGIGRQYDRVRVLLFPEHPEIDPANRRSEWGLPGAVMLMKVSHWSKNELGVRIYWAIKTLIATRALRRHSVARVLADLMLGRPMPSALARYSSTSLR